MQEVFSEYNYSIIFVLNTFLEKFRGDHFHFLEGSSWSEIRLCMRALFVTRMKMTGKRMVQPHSATTTDDLLALSKVFVIL